MGEANERAANGEGEASGVHRLRDIIVEEVSLVDLAANKRRFLVVKRSEAMADGKTAGPARKPEGRGGASGSSSGAEKAKKKPSKGGTAGGEEKPKTAAPHGLEPKEAEKARGAEGQGEAESSGGDEGGDKKQRRKAEGALLLAGPLKETALRVLAEALERLMGVAQRIKDAEETAEAPGERLPEEVVRELASISEGLQELGGAGPESAAKALVGKAGARMAKDRLARFQKAMALLAEILKEITEASGALPAPTAGAAQAGIEKREAASAPALSGLPELVAGISELTRVVKLQGDELAGLRKARGLSNALTLEAGPRHAEPQEVPWPLDMNRPISRDKVRKEVSFFDEE
jgi:hypothetical protein